MKESEKGTAAHRATGVARKLGVMLWLMAALTGALVTFLVGTAGRSAAQFSQPQTGPSTIGGPSVTGPTLTVEVEGEGIVTYSDRNVAPCQSECTTLEPPRHVVFLTAVPAQGYTFAGWTRGCAGPGAVCGVTAAGAPVVKARFVSAGTVEVTTSGPGTVTSDAGEIDCGVAADICTAPLLGGGQTLLTATSMPGATFVGWGGACAQFATAPCVLAASARSGVTATFIPGSPSTGPQMFVINHGILAMSSVPDTLGGCLLTSPCVTSVPAGTAFTLTAGGSFVDNPLSPLPKEQWTQGCIGNWPVCSIAVEGPTTIAVAPVSRALGTRPAASYNAPSITVTVSGGGSVFLSKRTRGSITCAHANAYSHPCTIVVTGRGFSLVARAFAHHDFQQWYGGRLFGVCVPVRRRVCSGSVSSGVSALAAVFG